MAASTVDIFSAYSLGMSKPKFSSMATTNSTESRESKPSCSKVALLLSLLWSHLAALLRISKTLPSTTSRSSAWDFWVEKPKQRVLTIIDLGTMFLMANPNKFLAIIIFIITTITLIYSSMTWFQFWEETDIQSKFICDSLLNKIHIFLPFREKG